jgi:hypothetical protein
MTSIWLRPEGRQEQQLQALIDRLAEEHGTVSFAPHLTVCGVPGDLGVLDAAAAYVRECGLLPIKIAKAAVRGAVITPFRAVFIEVENSPELREFRERLREIVGARQLIPRISACSIRWTGTPKRRGPISMPSSCKRSPPAAPTRSTTRISRSADRSSTMPAAARAMCAAGERYGSSRNERPAYSPR